MRTLVSLVLGVLIFPIAVLADSHVEQEVRQAVLDGFAHTREHKTERPDAIASAGSLEFWSSGGLMNEVKADAPPNRWADFNLYPKHIKVIPLGNEAAVAMYYSEGSMQPTGYDSVPHYLTRVMELYTKGQDGKWRRRAAHWSPVVGGSGTTQTAE